MNFYHSISKRALQLDFTVENDINYGDRPYHFQLLCESVSKNQMNFMLGNWQKT